MALFHVVDDEKFMGELIKKMLTMHEHEALIFQDPHQYLQFVDGDEYTPPAAVITDILMPTMDGYELINEVIRRNSHQKFIVISGTPHIEHQIKHKACHYLCKPFRVNELIGMANALARCDSEGPSAEIGCQEMGDRKTFVTEWHCPLPRPHQSS